MEMYVCQSQTQTVISNMSYFGFLPEVAWNSGIHMRDEANDADIESNVREKDEHYECLYHCGIS